MAAVMLTTKTNLKWQIFDFRRRWNRRFQIGCFKITQINFLFFCLALFFCLTYRHGTDVPVLINIIVDPNVDVQIKFSIFCLR